MPTFQNPGLVQDPSLLIGSVKAEVATVIAGPYTNVGLGRSFQLTEEITPYDVQVDNGPDPLEGIAEHELPVTFELVELYVPTHVLIRGGIDIESQTAGTPVVGATQQLENPFTPFEVYRIENQNGDGTALAAFTSVVGSTDGALTVNDDFFQLTDVLTNGDTETSIMMNSVAGGTNLTTTAQDITVTYDYTPNASREMSTGGLATISSRVWRFTNRQVISGSDFDRIIEVYKVSFEGGQTLAFNSDQATDPLTVFPFNLRGKLDTDRTDGDQLFKLTDEVGVA